LWIVFRPPKEYDRAVSHIRGFIDHQMDKGFPDTLTLIIRQYADRSEVQYMYASAVGRLDSGIAANDMSGQFPVSFRHNAQFLDSIPFAQFMDHPVFIGGTDFSLLNPAGIGERFPCDFFDSALIPCFFDPHDNIHAKNLSLIQIHQSGVVFIPNKSEQSFVQ
jgi:hypothetical protein